MRHLNIIDELDIKVMKTPMLSAVRNNAAFRKLTGSAHIATYSVNNRRCLGVTFKDPDDANINSLKMFCKKVLLESATIEIPWNNGRTIVFIHPTDRSSPSCLSNATIQGQAQ